MPLPVHFNRPVVAAKSAGYVAEAMAGPQLSGNGKFTVRCQEWLERSTGAPRVLLTTSCTAALEICALLLELAPGDEVIMPSFTFVTSASAFALRGAVPVFVDSDPRTQNLDPARVAAAITPRTRAILAVHYGGVACDMSALLELAERHGIKLVEDAAQGIEARWRGRALGTIGHLGTISFHDSKNIHCGEGGALLVNDPALVARAEILWEKGTNRQQFLRGQVDKYSWVALGSSFLPSELNAAFLLGQLEEATVVTEQRLALWRRYHTALEPLERSGQLVRPYIPNEATANAHIYYVILQSLAARTATIRALKSKGIDALFHYVPLHDSAAGRRYGRIAGTLAAATRAGERLLRLPLWRGMSDEPELVAAALAEVLPGA